MITKLRKRHRLFFIFLTPALVSLYGLALYSRPSALSYSEEELPPFFSKKTLPLKKEGKQKRKTLLLSKKSMRLGGILTTVRVWSFDGQYYLSLHTQGEEWWDKPDILLYAQKEETEGLGRRAYLLGALKDKKELWFPLPQIDKKENFMYGEDSVFILYSLGHSEVLARFKTQGKLP